MIRGKYTTPRNAVPPVIKMKAPVLDVAGLQAAYDWMPVDKSAAFKLAFEWYAANNAALLFGDPLDADRQKTYDRAIKSRALGNSSTYEGEKQQSWETSIHLMEKIWKSKNLPKLDDALKATEPGKRVASIQTVLGHLNAAYSAVGFTFRMTFESDRDLTENEIAIPEKEIDAMIPQAPLKTVLAEALTVAKAKSVVTDPDGQAHLDGAALMSNIPMILGHVADWAVNVNGSALKAVGKATSNKKSAGSGSAAPSGPRTKPAPLPAVDPFGYFKRNTVMANLTKVMADGKFHTIAELGAICHACGVTKPKPGQVKDVIEFLTKKGHKIEKQGDTVRVIR